MVDYISHLPINLGGNLSDPMRPRNTRGQLKCVHCSYSSYQRQNFERHILIHSDVRLKYSCQICPRSYTREDNLKRHMKEHFKKQWKKIWDSQPHICNQRNDHCIQFLLVAWDNFDWGMGIFCSLVYIIVEDTCRSIKKVCYLFRLNCNFVFI